MIAMPIAEPKLRKVWVTPEPWPRIASGRRLSASVLSGEKTRPKPAPVISIPQSVALWLSSERLPAQTTIPIVAEQEADRRPVSSPRPCPSSRRRSARRRRRNRTSSGSRSRPGSVPGRRRPGSTSQPKKKTASQGPKTRKVSRLSTANGRLASSALTSISGSSVLPLDRDEGGEDDDADDDRADRRRAAPAPFGRLLDAEHGQRHADDDQHGAAHVELGRVLDVVAACAKRNSIRARAARPAR